MIEKKKKSLKQGGFTLIELIVVMAVLAILILLAAPRFIGQTERARQTQIKNDLKVVDNAINEYLMTHHDLPDEWFQKVGLDADVNAGKVYGLKGVVDVVEPNEYRIISPDFVADKARSNLSGEFIASDDGDTYYIDENGTHVKKPDSLTEVPEGWIPIWNAQDFKSIGRDAAFPADGKFIQMAEVDMKGEEYVPLGGHDGPFDGKYNGNGHAFVNQERPLFAHVSAEAELFGITSKQVNIAYEDTTVATIAIVNEGTLSDITIEGVVSGEAYYDEDDNQMTYTSQVAGVVAINKGGTLQDIRFDGELNGVNEEDASLSASSVAGIVNISEGGSFENITVNATIKNNGEASGFINGAYNNPINMTDVAVSGSIESLSGPATGLVNTGYNKGTIANASFEGDITAGTTATGVLGQGDMAVYTATVDGTITGTTLVAGITGQVNAYHSDYTDRALIADVSVKGDIRVVGSNSDAKVGGIVALGSASDRSIRNATFDGTVVGGPWNTGGIVGYSYMDIENAHVTGSVSGGNQIGGLSGINQGAIIKDSSVTADVTGTGKSVGGIAGWNDADITNSFVKGNVVGGSSETGGLVGVQFYSEYKYPAPTGTISKSYVIGNVSGVNDVGGLVGANYGHLKDSYVRGDVTATGDYAGAITGSHYEKGIERSYAIGNVRGNDYVGLIAGRSHAVINDVYAKGSITAVPEGSNVASTIGYNTFNIKNIYVESDDSLALLNSVYGETVGVHKFAPGTNYAAQKDALLADGWDFEAVWEIKNGELQLQ